MENKYNKTFLTNVIVRANFPNSIETSSLPSDLKDVILKSFPISEPKKMILVESEIKIVPKSKIEIETGQETMEWHYYGKNREKELVINEKFISISYMKWYDSFEYLKNEFLTIITKLIAVFENDIQINRLGLRYINEIDLDETNALNWDNYLDNNLLSIFNIVEDKEIIERGFNNLVLNYGDMILNFQYGMHNPDFPALIRKKIFILDYDANFTALQDLGDIEPNLIYFHDEIQKLFEQNIKEDLRKIMNG